MPALLPLFLVTSIAVLVVSLITIGADLAFVARPRARGRFRARRWKYVALALAPALAAVLGVALGAASGTDVLGWIGGIGVATASSCVATFPAVDGALSRLVVRLYERRLGDPRKRQAALAKLEQRLAAAAGDSNHAYARALMHAVHVLTRAHCWQIVLDVTREARVERLNAGGRRLLCIYGALAQLHLGQLDAARKWLDSVDGPVDAAYRAWHIALDAVLSAAEGRPSRAREVLAHLDGESYELERDVTLAHILAAEGRSAEAQQALIRVQIQHRDTTLESMALLPGPASPLATAVVHGNLSPYR